MRTAVAVAIGDCHFSHDVPVARGETRDEWYQLQEDYCGQIARLADGLPIITPGDVLDRWDSPAELINLLLRIIPDNFVAVAGNHDLPNHSLGQIERSAYWTLVKAGKILHLESTERKGIQIDQNGQIAGHGFSCGREIREPINIAQYMRIAVVHDYIWSNSNNKYPGAHLHQMATEYLRKLEGYDVAVFGDNHKAVTCNIDKRVKDSPSIINCGTVIRRKSDEMDHKPHVGIIFDDGTIEKQYLNTSQDKWREGISEAAAQVTGISVDEFLETVRALADKGFNYNQAVRDYCSKFDVSSNVRKLMLNILEESLQ